MYTCAAPTPAATLVGAVALVEALKALRPRPSVLDWDALVAEGAAALCDGLRAGGYRTERYRHFGTWRADLRGLSFNAYLAERPGKLRSTLSRKRRKLDREGGTFARFERSDEAEAAIAAYAAAHAGAWQAGEPHPDFLPALVRRGLAAGEAEVFALQIGERVIASQIWLVRGARATLFKLAFDADHAAYSPGTVLTGHAIETLMASGALDAIDFGRGDDAYKKDWAPDREQLWGVRAYDPSTLTGALGAIFSNGKSVLRPLITSLRRR